MAWRGKELGRVVAAWDSNGVVDLPAGLFLCRVFCAGWDLYCGLDKMILGRQFQQLAAAFYGWFSYLTRNLKAGELAGVADLAGITARQPVWAEHRFWNPRWSIICAAWNWCTPAWLLPANPGQTFASEARRFISCVHVTDTSLGVMLLVFTQDQNLRALLFLESCDCDCVFGF